MMFEIFMGTLTVGFTLYAVVMLYFLNLNHAELIKEIEHLTSVVERLEFLKVDYKAYMGKGKKK